MQPMLLRRWRRIALLLPMLACGGAASGPSDPVPKALRVLFIGNSLTYTNDLDAMVRGLAKESGLNFETDIVAHPNYALIDHLQSGGALEKVRDGHFDIVVLQQGPSSIAVNRDSLRMWTAMWASEIRNAGGVPALFAVWPERDRAFAFPAVSESYRLAASDVNGIFLPVGDTWLKTWETRPAAPLYSSDDYHPAIAGSYAAAVVIVAVLGKRSATSLAPSWGPSVRVGAIDTDLAADIRAAADAVIGTSGIARLSPR